MKNELPDRIVDPNGITRSQIPAIGIGFLALSILMTAVDVRMLPVSIISILGAALVVVVGVGTWPYIELNKDGVHIRFFYREKFYRWAEISQIGILQTKAPKVDLQYKYPVVILCPNGSQKGTQSGPRFLRRNLFRVVSIPNTPEIRMFLLKYYGVFDFDDTEKLGWWERRNLGMD